MIKKNFAKIINEIFKVAATECKSLLWIFQILISLENFLKKKNFIENCLNFLLWIFVSMKKWEAHRLLSLKFTFHWVEESGELVDSMIAHLSKNADHRRSSDIRKPSKINFWDANKWSMKENFWNAFFSPLTRSYHSTSTHFMSRLFICDVHVVLLMENLTMTVKMLLCFLFMFLVAGHLNFEFTSSWTRKNTCSNFFC